MSPLYVPTGSLDLQTRGGRSIENYFDRRAPLPGEIMRADHEERRYPGVVRRTSELSSVYNCHGLTFASRRTGISSSAEIAKILTDDEYTEVAESEVLPGDIVIWYNDANGDAEHSAIVLQRLPDLAGVRRGFLVLSKWGDAREYVHALHECPYVQHSRKAFYRINR